VSPAPPPAIILVRPQLGENIGKVARAMANFGHGDLRLVAPRDGWPNPAAVPAAAGADRVLDEARVFATVADAVADLTALYATTARTRDMIKPVVTPRHAAEAMRGAPGAARAGVLFGAEAAGLSNDELITADALVAIPCDPGFSSLNIAQAVVIIAYEWFLAGQLTPATVLDPRSAVAATRGDIEGFLVQLEEELELSGFLRPVEKAPAMKRNIRNLFLRAPLFDQDVRTLRGIVRSLALFGRSRSDGRER